MIYVLKLHYILIQKTSCTVLRSLVVSDLSLPSDSERASNMAFLANDERHEFKSNQTNLFPANESSIMDQNESPIRQNKKKYKE